MYSNSDINIILLSGNATVPQQMTSTGTWSTLSSATRENDVTVSLDTNIEEAGRGSDAGWAAETTAGDVLAVIVAVGLIGVVIVSVVYCVRACARYDDRRRYRKMADTEPLLIGDDSGTGPYGP